jgi:hypothetical protein
MKMHGIGSGGGGDDGERGGGGSGGGGSGGLDSPTRARRPFGSSPCVALFDSACRVPLPPRSVW